MKMQIKVSYLTMLCLSLFTQARAATSDIADAPLVTSATSSVLPNVMFILDDSGSMFWDFMPDIVNDNYCKATSGQYNFTCCADSATSTGTGTGSAHTQSCWVKSTTDTAPFGTWRGQPLFLSGEFNGVMYNPAITYTPPLKADGTSYASMTSTNTSTWTLVPNDAYGIQNTQKTNLVTDFPDLAWCDAANTSDCLRNDNYILPGTVNGKSYTVFKAVTGTGSGQVVTGSPYAPSTATRNFGPHFYTIIPGEYCDSPVLRNCQATQTALYSYPAPVRWCSNTASTTAAPSLAITNCQATRTSTFQYIRYPTKYYTPAVVGSPGSAAVPAKAAFTINLTGCKSGQTGQVQQITANGVNLMSGASSSTSSASTLAASVASKITLSGYSATVASNNVTITAPVSAGNLTAPLVFTSSKSGGCNLTFSGAQKFSGYVAAVPPVTAADAIYYGSFIRTDIVSGNNSYPFPGTATKASTRTDCAGSTCTYAEEMTNFANWWAYYHTRMQMMKSSASISFAPIDKRFRVGYYTIDNANGSDFMNPAPFESTQKTTWYDKLVKAKPYGSTPLREALSAVGRLYAGKLSKLNNVTVTDPIQYSCQQNFTILSTDGYWNGGAGKKIDGTTDVGEQDASLGRPQKDASGTNGAGTPNTLADVAAYYYNTDLRSSTNGNCSGSGGNDVCENNVPVSGLDAAAHQHMTTFTVGLGASGYMQYTPSYATATSGDYFNVKNGSTVDVAGGICSWQASGTCTWPNATNDSPTAIDDLWHAAVNGYGTYFSASNPAVLSTALSTALAGVSARTGASSAATTSNPNIASGDNFLFSSTFTSVNWDGEMVRQQINLETGAINTAYDWSAQSKLDSNSARTIYTYAPANTNKLKTFTWANLTDEASYFSKPHINGLSQFCSLGVTCLPSATQTAAQGEALVNFLRGDRTNEGADTDISKYFRQRNHILGDIVNSEAVYVKTPPFKYNDDGYSEYKATAGSRQGAVYVGANDGMLHAFNADNGEELWAYVPSLVIPNLYRLADKGYETLHRYSVDGTVVQGDIYASGWKSIVVAGLNAGGRGYFALDVTDPTNPKALWEFTYDTSKGTGYTKDADLGYTFGKPEIAKLKDGTWVVMVSSGYNNVSPGDGKGYLYILRASDGNLLYKIGTGEGSTGTPSGLGQIRAWADSADLNNLALRAYAGDMQGNVWRFDIDDNIAPSGREAQKLANLLNDAGQIQPITSKPEIGLVDGIPVVFIGTGRYLGVTDLTDTTKQSIYGIKDNLGTSSFGNPRSNSTFVKQTMTATTCPAGTATSICTTGQLVRTSTDTAVNWGEKNGWYVDLLDSGERANTDPQLSLGTLVFTTNVPNASACTIGGYSYLYFLDFRNGGTVKTSTTGVTGKILANALSTRPVIAKLPNNKVISITRKSDGNTAVDAPPFDPPGSTLRRVTWRELVTD